MQITSSIQKHAGHSRTRLLSAALGLIRMKGYAATTVDDLCGKAGVSKGAFFHNFSSKEALAVAAADHWTTVTRDLFAEAAFHDLADPVDRVMGYVDFRCQLLEGPVETFTCLAGTMVQETFRSSEAIREACEASILDHARTLEADIFDAIAASGVTGVTGVTARSLALYTQTVLQGAFILSKATGGPDIARESVGHLKCYFELLFRPP